MKKEAPSQMRFITLLCVCWLVSVLYQSSASAYQFGGGGIFIDDYGASAATQTKAQSTLVGDALLKSHGVGIDPESIRHFLDELTPSVDDMKRGRDLIKLLGDDRYEIRQQATNQLTRWQALPGELFEEALQSDDPEAAFRCRQILEARKSSIMLRLQTAVFRHIANHKLSGLANDIVTAYPQLTTLQSKVAACKAILVTAERDDIRLLKTLVDHEDMQLRVAAFERLIQLDLDNTLPLLEQISKTADEKLRLQIARLYAQENRKESLDLLLDLLNADDASTRGRAFAWLRRATDHHIAIPTWQKGTERDESIQQWRDWVAANRDELEIDFTSSAPKLGRILVGLYTGNKVVEFDMTGKQVWEAPLASAFACHGLPNGHRLVACYSKGEIVEYDAEGKVFKKFNSLPKSISSVERLENGNTLCAAGQSGNLIFEIDPKGKIIWQRKINGVPVHVQMLETGRMLVSFNQTKEVTEVDREGKVYWQVDLDEKPYSSSRLLNGNTLVSFADGGLVEYDSDGEKLREFATDKHTYHGEMMEDGNIIYADRSGISIINPAGEKVQSITDYTEYLYLNHY